MPKSAVHSFLQDFGIVLMQLLVSVIFKLLKIEPNTLYAHSTGYFDKTHKENFTILIISSDAYTCSYVV